MINKDYKFNEQERASIRSLGWDPDLFSSINIKGNKVSFCYDGIWILNKDIPGNPMDYGHLLGRRLYFWLGIRRGM